MNEIYERIKRMCQEDGTTITEMCRAIGVSPGAITDFKMGRTKSLSTDTIGKIADHFRVSTDYVLGRTDDPIDYENYDEYLPNHFIGNPRGYEAYKRAVDKDVMAEQKAFAGADALKIEGAYLSMAKEAQNRGIDPKDILKIMDVLKKNEGADE